MGCQNERIHPLDTRREGNHAVLLLLYSLTQEKRTTPLQDSNVRVFRSPEVH